MKGSLLIVAVGTALALLVATPLWAERQWRFDDWLADLRREALAKGISQSTVDHVLKGLEPMPRVIELDQNQPEFTLTLDEYLRRVLSENRVSRGRTKLEENRTLLEGISQRYGVQPRFLVALWGIETHFGQWTGDFPVVGATATLAYNGRRSNLFRKELLHALRILDQGHIPAEKMIGSWAGAMGPFQFMPSSFHRFAVDYDGDGRRDIWNNLADGFASAANYLSQSGWARDQNWGQAVCLPERFDRTLFGLKVRKRVSEWQGRGVRPVSGQNLPAESVVLASVLEPDGSEGQVFLVYQNYHAILNWNRSQLFGIAVGTLADRIVRY